MSGHAQKSFKVRLHALSPLHIGCDDAYEPTGFVVDRAGKQLIAFDPVDFVRSLDGADRQKFLTICEKGTLGSLIELYKFMDGRKAAVQGRAIGISDGFLAGYDRVLRLPPGNEREIRQELNKFLIARTSYLSRDHAAYIPGSSLKGTLRTGWLNHLHGGVVKKLDARQAKDFEKNLLGGSFDADPIRMVKVSDLTPVGQPRTLIRFAVNRKKKPSKHEAQGPQQILEVIHPDQNAVFEGMITLLAAEQGARITRPVPTGDEFFRRATEFFVAELATEETMLRGINLPAEIQKRLQQLFGAAYLKNVFPVRLGRHSGADAVTIKGLRAIKIIGKKGEPAKIGPTPLTTWLAGDSPRATAGLQPFGWAALEILPADFATPWRERVVIERAPQIVAAPSRPTPATPAITAETLLWESALLIWAPGNATLTVVGEDGKKAAVKLAGDRSLVPAALHKSLFDKKKATPAKVTVKKEGNLFEIAKIEEK